jgi:hypothetical protein
VFVAAIVIGCVTIGTENPTDPEADNPIVLGDESMDPLGCMIWKSRDGENADC